MILRSNVYKAEIVKKDFLTKKKNSYDKCSILSK